MEICKNCCPTLRHASWQSCTVGASTVPVWHIHGMHKHSWWGTVFPNLQGQTPMVKWLKNGWIGWWMVIEEMMSFWERKAISSLKIKMLDLVMSEICWSERNRWFCAARQMSWWPVVLPWGLEPTLAWWRRSDFFHPTFHLLDVLRSSCGITILITKWGAPPVLSDSCLSNSFFDWHCQKCRGLYIAVQGVDLGLLKNHAWRCACLWVPLPCVRMQKDPWNNWCNKKNIHKFV